MSAARTKKTRKNRKARLGSRPEAAFRKKIDDLQRRLSEASETLEAIRSGQVDAFVTSGPDGEKVFTLAGAERPYRVLVENMNEGAATLASDGMVIYCNRRFAEMLEYPIERVPGTPILTFVSPEDGDKFEEMRAGGRRGRSSGEIRLRRSSGTLVPVQASFSPLELETPGVCVVFTDLSQLREANARLLEAQREMEQSKRLSDMGVLAATVAHELRNPLAAIAMAGSNIKRKASNPDLDRHLDTIRKKIDESSQIINNLLAFARLRTPHHQNIRLLELLEECIDMAKRPVERKTMIKGNFAAVQNTWIEADPTQMRELFGNILNNARDAVSDTDGRVVISATCDDGRVTVAIEDNGIGMDGETLARAFEPFFSTKAKGTGLGLPVCSQIVDMHGGEIHIDSAPGKGTTVTVCLPQAGRSG